MSALRLSRVRVGVQLALHVALAAHVVAYYAWDVTTIGSLDFQDFFHNLLGEGIVTAAVLFASTVYLLSFVWGRLFCSWGCHFAAVQDLAAWVLRRLGWSPPVVRTRLLHWVPCLLLVGLFLAPNIGRWIDSGWSFRGAGPDGPLGGAGPWERLPGWILSVVTFLVCGVAVLFALGTRGFCRFVCPYGAVFRITERVTPFRVRRLRGCATSCADSTTPPCTAACPTAIDVHAETAAHGAVRSIDCVRCHLCIEACPSQALAYSARTVASPATPANGSAPIENVSRAPAPTWSLGEELLVLAVALGTFVVCDGVFGGHFLVATMALGEGLLAVAVLRFLRGRAVSPAVAGTTRSRARRRLGWLAVALMSTTWLAIGHAAAFQVHRALGMAVFDDERERDEIEAGARVLELVTRDRDRLASAADHLERALWRFPSDLGLRRALCKIRVEMADERAVDEAREIVRRSGESRRALEELRAVYLRFGRFAEARWIEMTLAAD